LWLATHYPPSKRYRGIAPKLSEHFGKLVIDGRSLWRLVGHLAGLTCCLLQASKDAWDGLLGNAVDRRAPVVRKDRLDRLGQSACIDAAIGVAVWELPRRRVARVPHVPEAMAWELVLVVEKLAIVRGR